jgi:hypothetical protein
MAVQGWEKNAAETVERDDTEDAAIRRLCVLQDRAEFVEGQSSAMRPAPKTRH